MFDLILDKFYDGRFTKLVDSFDKSLLFSISFTMEGSLVIARKFVSPNIHSYIFAQKLVHRKGRVPKNCLALFKIADKISTSQRVLPKVSQRYIPHNVTFKNDRNELHFMTGAAPLTRRRDVYG